MHAVICIVYNLWNILKPVKPIDSQNGTHEGIHNKQCIHEGDGLQDVLYSW